MYLNFWILPLLRLDFVIFGLGLTFLGIDKQIKRINRFSYLRKWTTNRSGVLLLNVWIGVAHRGLSFKTKLLFCALYRNLTRACFRAVHHAHCITLSTSGFFRQQMCKYDLDFAFSTVNLNRHRQQSYPCFRVFALSAYCGSQIVKSRSRCKSRSHRSVL